MIIHSFCLNKFSKALTFFRCLDRPLVQCLASALGFSIQVNELVFSIDVIKDSAFIDWLKMCVDSGGSVIGRDKGRQVVIESFKDCWCFSFNFAAGVDLWRLRLSLLLLSKLFWFLFC